MDALFAGSDEENSYGDRKKKIQVRKPAMQKRGAPPLYKPPAAPTIKSCLKTKLTKKTVNLLMKEFELEG